MSNKYWNVHSLRNKAFLWQYKDIAVFRSLVKPQKNEKILDVGCGFSPLGQAFYPFILPTGLICGIDIDPEIVIAAKDFVKTIDRQKNFDFNVGDAYNLSHIFLTDTFDIVMCQQFLINMSDPLKVILEMKKVCNPEKGRIFAVENCNLGAFIISPNLSNSEMLQLSQIYQKIIILGQNMIEGGNTIGGLYISQYFQKIGLHNIQSLFIIPDIPILDFQNTLKQQNNPNEQIKANDHLLNTFSRWAKPLIPDIISYDDWTFFKDKILTIDTTIENFGNNSVIQTIHPLVATIGWMNSNVQVTNNNLFPINI